MERISTSSGQLTGWLTLALAGLVVVLGVLEGSWAVAAAAALVGVLAWASVLRPALFLDDGRLVLRTMFESVHVPLAAIEQLVVRQVLVLRAGDKRYTSSAVGRTWRQALRRRGGRAERDPGGTGGLTMSEADVVEERLHGLMEEARAAAGVTSYSDEQLALADGVRREPGWLPIAAVALAVAAVVLALLA